MHQCTLVERSSADALELAGICTPTACHMLEHMCAHLLKAAGTHEALACFFFFAEILIGCSFSEKWFLDHLLWHFSNLFSWHHTYPLMCIIFHSNYFYSSHRHHDRRLSLTLTDCQQKAATSERVNPAHRSVLPPQ